MKSGISGSGSQGCQCVDTVSGIRYLSKVLNDEVFKYNMMMDGGWVVSMYTCV